MNSSTSSTASNDRRRKKQGIFGATTTRNEGFWNAFNSFRHHTKSEPTQSTLSSWRTTPATAPSTSSNSRSEEQPTFKSPFPPKNNQITTNVNGGDGSPNVKRNRIHAGLGTHSPSAVKTIDITNPQPYKFENEFERLTSGRCSDEKKSTVCLAELSERTERQLSHQNSQTQHSGRKDDSNCTQRQGNSGSAIGLVRHFLMDINDNEPSSDYVNRTQLDRLKKADQILHIDLFRKDRPAQRAGAGNNYNNFKKAKQGRFYRLSDSEINDGSSIGQTSKKNSQWTAPVILSCSTPYTAPSPQRREFEMAN